jgi:hypothetical protein
MTESRFGMRFALAALATWRLTHLLASEDGPGGAIVALRARAGPGPLGELMDCFYCLSIWVAVPFGLALSGRRSETPVTCLALSGAACLLERLVPEPQVEGTGLAEEVDGAVTVP